MSSTLLAIELLECVFTRRISRDASRCGAIRIADFLKQRIEARVDAFMPLKKCRGKACPLIH
jgi:hypothetical protein